MGLAVPVASPEDTILSKLEWATLEPSERQLRDALGVAALQGDQLDRAYLRKWAKELGVAEQLEEILRQAERLQRPPKQPSEEAAPG